MEGKREILRKKNPGGIAMPYPLLMKTMIDFKDLTIEDKPRIGELICASGCHGADYNFANIFMWRHTYKPRLAYISERIIVFMPEGGGLYAYPKGRGKLEHAIAEMRSDARERGIRFQMRGLTERVLEEFLPIYGNEFDIIEDRDNADYIYTVDKLCNLRGRHLSSKRNHIKHFERNGDWNFTRITAENLSIARDFTEEFYDIKSDPSLEPEAKAIGEMFKYYEELEFYGGMLSQNGKPVAFTAGTRLDDATFDTHFEKALPNVEAAYTMVNREFARMIHELLPDIEYFNREEDIGIEGLRRSKESYRPDKLLMKYTVIEKE